MLKHYEIIVRVGDTESIEEVGIDHNRPTYPDKLYWGLLRFDKNGLFFHHPDMAKFIAMHEHDNDYRDMRDAFVIPSMSGYARALLKKKEPKDKKKAEKEDAIFWAAFKTWTE
jgi:hypothetical protein